MCVGVALLLLCWARPARAGSVTLAWDANTESTLAGYVVLYGTQSRVYTHTIDVGNQTIYTISSLAPGTYYFTVQAYDTDGLYSGDANEVSTTVKASPATTAPDMDGDSKSDLMVWRPTTGMWYWLESSTSYAYASAGSMQWGNSSLGDIPLSGDIDGDGIADLVIWRGSTGAWFWLTSSSGYNYASAGGHQLGAPGNGDVPMLGDVDGDGRADLIIWRASTGTWYWRTSSSGYSDTAGGSAQWGNQSLGDVPLIGDIDGDGKADLIVWRASTGTWYWLTSSSGYTAGNGVQWGNQSLGDVPLVGDIDGDGKTDLIVWRASTGTWFWLMSASGYSYNAMGTKQWGNQSLGDVPYLTDIDGDGRADLTVWRASTGTWFWLTSSSGYAYSSAGSKQWGAPNLDKPIVR